jgi:mannose-P-dolichol utilization defect protein 1
MAEIIKRIILLVLSHHCYDEFFRNFNFFDGPCLQATLSKILGLGMVAGSVMVICFSRYHEQKREGGS